ncbi:MAG: hypothetical protein QOJ64_1371 [Acidobacteriota bacterium]|jgi:ribosomal protein L16/L10AE|nr:hypothetical protein [Acidobacteriota bacterium]
MTSKTGRRLAHRVNRKQEKSTGPSKKDGEGKLVCMVPNQIGREALSEPNQYDFKMVPESNSWVSQSQIESVESLMLRGRACLRCSLIFIVRFLTERKCAVSLTLFV